MKWIFLLATFFAAFLIAFGFKHSPSLDISSQRKTVVSCSPDRTFINELIADADIPPMPGAGNYRWQISTSNDSAQFYFNQGINMYYGFHIIEALASFKKAATFDPQNPMIWWAQALTYGPNINDVGYNASPLAYEASQKAIKLSGAASQVEKMLINAMALRYSNDTTSREKLNQRYVDAMRKMYEKFSSHPDVAALYADALMLQHPWDLWNTDGTPKSWTPAIRTVLEKMLAKHPKHPGANHYYIHVMEASPYAALALPSADRLGTLTPGLSHMVHMPSHIYLRTGQYNKGTTINEAAVAMFKKYASLFPAVNENAFLYQWHNLHMQANSGLLAGRYQYSLEAANELQSVIDTSLLSMAAPMGSYVQYIYMTPALINIHFGKWDKVLQMPAPAEHHIYASILYHFARGMAYSALSRLEDAIKEKSALQNLMADNSLAIPMSPFSPAIEGANCANYLLTALIEMKKGSQQVAEENFKKAVLTESNMVYNEPRDWLLNPRQYLGNFYLKTGQWEQAEKVLSEDMKRNNENVWALFGLTTALQKQGKTEKRKITEGLFQKAIKQADYKKPELLF